MSATQRVKQGFLRLPTAKKFLLVSSFTLMTSGVLPWYDNQNTFGSGEAYLGIQGPLYMLGIIIIGLGFINFMNMFIPLFGKNFGKLRKNTGVISMIIGAQSALLLLVGNTVFFHTEFGINANHKATSIGMTLAFLSVGVMLIAGWWAKRKEASGEYERIEKELEEAEAAAAVIRAVTPPEPVPVNHRPIYQEPRYVAPRPEAQEFQEPVQVNQYKPVQSAQETYGDNIDPLTLDAKTRYKLMRQRMRSSTNSRNNLWGGSQSQSEPYGARNDRRLP